MLSFKGLPPRIEAAVTTMDRKKTIVVNAAEIGL